MKSNIYFISGIDTDIGKSIAVGMMARFLHHTGKHVITLKLVQTGNTGFSEDIARHREIMGSGLFPEDMEHVTAPEIYTFPASPRQPPQNAKGGRIFPTAFGAESYSIRKNFFCSSQSAGSPVFNDFSVTWSGRAPMIARWMISGESSAS